ncbi:MAG: energy-coupling factor transporter transmembrane component T [Peptostreptococcaceae bacterium]|nr:energy-coupling factor transporter transmembrane component T [Peptostreptococcaceae bacterium]
MKKSCKQNGIRYDPRIKLLQVLIIGILVFTLTGKKYEVLLFLSAFVYGMLSGIYKTCFRVLAFYVVLFMIAEISPLFISTTIHYFILCFVTLALAAANMIKTSEISEILASLQNMKVPYYINIPLAVILRFFPTLKQDVIYIKQGIKTRGIDISFFGVIRRPFKVYEMMLIPMLMRMLYTASELSASVETRGLGVSCKKTSYTEVKFRRLDMLLMVIMIVFYLIIIIMKIKNI